MNLEQAKAKLASISKSTGTKHPKVLVSELCSIVGFLLGEIERIKTIDPPRPQRQPDVPCNKPPWPNKDKDRRIKRPDLKPWKFGDDEKRLNAGDAE